MAGLRSLRNLFARRRTPVVVDISGESEGSAADDAAPTSNFNGGALAATGVESKPLTRRSAASAEVQRGRDEVVDLMRRVGEHLDSQTQRADKLVDLLGNLPAALQAVPELSQQNSRFMQALSEQLAQAKHRDEPLLASLATIGDSLQRHTEVLGLIQQQLDYSSAVASQLGGTLDNVRESLRELSTSNSQTSRVLSQMADDGRIRDNNLTTIVASTRKWFIIAMICCVVASLGAIGVALFAILNA